MISNILNLHRKVAMEAEIDKATKWLQLMLEGLAIVAVLE